MADIIILHGDLSELCKDLPDNSIDMIFTDPPYPREFLPLFSVLGEVANRVLKPGGYLFTYTGQYFLPEVIANVSHGDLVYYWCCATLHTGGIRIVRATGAQNGWKPILVFAKGKPGVHRVFSDKYTGTRSKVYHEWGQDESTAAYYILQFTEEGDTVLDPFCGGGTTAYACAQLNRNCITMDVDPKAVETSQERVMMVQRYLVPDKDLQAPLWAPQEMEL